MAPNVYNKNIMIEKVVSSMMLGVMIIIIMTINSHQVSLIFWQWKGTLLLHFLFPFTPIPIYSYPCIPIPHFTINKHHP